jgi:peptidoglycan/LPS O-acetylase OafA/YrhL
VGEAPVSVPSPARLREEIGRPARQRFACFEGLRAIAAGSVLVHHVASFSGADLGTSAGYVYAHLDVGVTIFFLLSGFLLYRPRVAAHLRREPEPALGTYLLRRAARLMPAYWLALTFFIAVGAIHPHGIGDYLAYYGFVQIYWRSRTLGGIAPAYSLAIEVSFYVFLPFYSAAIRRFASFGAELAGAALLYVTGLTTHTLLLATHPHPTIATYWLPAQIDLFALGMGLAVVSAWSADRGRVPALFEEAGRRPGMCWAIAVAAFLVSATALGLPRGFGDLPRTGEMGRQVLYAATAFFLVLPAVFGPQDRGRIRGLLRSRPAQLLGIISYGIFLWHFDWLVLLKKWGVIASLGQFRFVALLLITVTLSVSCAAISWRVVERPILRWAHGIRP